MESTATETELEGGDARLAIGAEPFAGKYVIERVLGQGGMGIVVAARHRRMGQHVAIKVLGSALREYPELVARFEREARAAGSLTSPHVARVFDIDTTEDGTPYMVMELLLGKDLGDILESEGPLDPARAIRYLLEACEAIAEAHERGIIHRDIKPSNLFVANHEGGTIVKVLDFGIAKHAKAGDAALTTSVAPLGTPQYMSPEQVRCAKDVDSRTDIWSLGVTLYELVTGRTPFAHEVASACIASIAADPVPDPRTFRPDLSEGVVAVIMRALEKNPADRFPDVASLVDALAPLVDAKGEDVVVAPRPRLALVSSSDRTVPPAVMREATAAAPRRRVPRLVALSVAAAAALVIVPRCVGSMGDAVAPPKVAAAVVATAPAAPIALPIASTAASLAPTAVPIPSTAALVAPAAAPTPAASSLTVPSANVVRAAPPAPATAPSLTARLAPPAPALSSSDAKRARARGDRAGGEVVAHGGLSSPGF
ncbi:MAG: serine/threonine protein kinase [Deltaproteobacteria bacterium]|nr:serine/threonine protein kinase [Deltaproteobacteria bacterium]